MEASQKQISYIKDLCLKKGIEFNEKFVESAELASAVIKKLLTKPDKPEENPASEKQIELIKQYAETLGIEVETKELTGGREGTASILINELKEKVECERQNVYTTRPATPKQKELITQMQLSVDVYALTAHCMTEEEVEQMTLSSASEYISKYAPTYYKWQTKCPTPQQISTIKKLHEHLESPIDDVVILNIPPTAVEKYIKQLYTELADKVWLETTLPPEEMRGIPTIEDTLKDKRYTEQKSIIARLYSMVGQQAECETMTWEEIVDLIDFIAEELEQPVSTIWDVVDNWCNNLYELFA